MVIEWSKFKYLVVLRNLRDLIRLAYFYTFKTNSKKNLIYRVPIGKKCYYFSLNDSSLISNKVICFLVEMSCKENKPNFFRYSFYPREKIEPLNNVIDLEEEDVINVIEIEELEGIDALEHLLLGNPLGHVNPSNIQKIFNVNTVYDFIELARLAAYYFQPLFCYKCGEKWFYLLNLRRGENTPYIDNVFNNIVLGSEGPKPKKGDKLAYFIIYSEGDENKKDSFHFERGVKLLDYFSPVITMKKIYVFKTAHDST